MNMFVHEPHKSHYLVCGKDFFPSKISLNILSGSSSLAGWQYPSEHGLDPADKKTQFVLVRNSPGFNFLSIKFKKF